MGIFAVASLVLVACELRWLSVPLPHLRRQVPAAWRNRFSADTVGFLYGWILGLGLLTHVTSASFYLACLGAVVLGDAYAGALVLGLFGLARAAPVLALATAAGSRERAFFRHDQASARGQRWILYPSAAVMVAMATAAFVALADQASMRG